MNNEDMSEMIQKLSSMMNNSNNSNFSNNDNNQDISSNSNDSGLENLQYILSNINLNSSETENINQENSSNNNNNNNFNIDFETILKIKNIMDKFNSTKNSPEANLLLSLKPYLNNSRKQKLDQYMQFLNITKVLEAFNSNGGVNNDNISQ